MAKDAIARLHEGNEGNPEALRRWYEAGAEGGIQWGQGGDWQQCVDIASRYMSGEDAKGYCELRHQAATGMSTEEHKDLIEGSERAQADQRTEMLALHSDWNPWPAQRDGARSAFSSSLRKHLGSAHAIDEADLGKTVKALHAQHHEVHAQEGTSEGANHAPMGESDVHVPHFLPNLSIDYAPGQPSVSGQSAGMHTHPKADSGVEDHDHPAPSDATHDHAPDDPQNATSVRLLPVTPDAHGPAASNDKAGANRAMDTMTKLNAMTKPQKLRMTDEGMDTDERADLSDAQFAATWTDASGKKQRKLPIHDAGHAKNAMSRFNQTQGMPSDVKKRAARKVLSAARKFGVTVGDNNPLKSVAASEVMLVLGEAHLPNYEVIETAEILRVDISDIAPLLTAEGDGDGDEPADTSMATCSTCEGQGTIREGGVTCPVCKGKGRVPKNVAAAEPQVIALDFGEESFNLGEHRQPYLVTGHWDFPDTSIGKLDIERRELESVVSHFKENARGQDLPIIDIDHVDPVFRGAAVGWVSDLQLREDHPKTGGPWIEAILDLNPVGEQLKANDQFRYGSPTLLRNWQDPATGHTYPLIAAGVDVRTRRMAMGGDGKLTEADRSALAWTNKPRLKQLGRIAASEDGTQVVVLAMADVKQDGAKPKADPESEDNLGEDKPASPKKVEEHQHRIWHYSEERNPAKVARALTMHDPIAATNDPDGDGDDDGPVPPCRNQPSQGGGCPGYTRWPGDTDGDGVCLLATRGCNGYVSGLGNGPTLGILPFNDQSHRSAQRMDQPEVKASEAPPDAASPPAAAPVESTPSPTQATADAAGAAAEIKMAEAERRSLMQRVEAAEQTAAAATEEAKRANARADLKELAEKQAVIVDRLGHCLRTGRIDKHEHATLCEPANIVLLAENDEKFGFVIKMLEERPASFSVPLGEVGSGQTPAADMVDATRLAERTQEILKAAEGSGKRMDAIQAARQAAREMAPSVRGGVR